MPQSRPLSVRFWEKVDRRGADECWPWIGALGGRDKRGNIAEGAPSQKILFAHRVAYEMANGPIPDGLRVLHSCDYPRCVNPAHLFLGTQQENIQDMIEKGRQRGAKGERNRHAKLTKEQVDSIREEYVRGSTSKGQVALAKKYGVSQPAIGYIVRGINW